MTDAGWCQLPEVFRERLFFGGCFLVGVNVQYKELHISCLLPFAVSFRVLSPRPPYPVLLSVAT